MLCSGALGGGNSLPAGHEAGLCPRSEQLKSFALFQKHKRRGQHHHGRYDHLCIQNSGIRLNRNKDAVAFDPGQHPKKEPRLGCQPTVADGGKHPPLEDACHRLPYDVPHVCQPFRELPTRVIISQIALRSMSWSRCRAQATGWLPHVRVRPRA